MRTTLQIPIDMQLKLTAEKTALSLGLSSLQEAVRVFLTQLSQKNITITLINSPGIEFLSAKEEAVLIKEHNKLQRDIKLGRHHVAHSAKELMDQLNQ